MHPEFWHQAWQNGRTAFHQERFHDGLVRWWPTLDVPRGARVFVPLAGRSLDMLWLRDQGLEVMGVELSGIACRQFFEEAGLTPVVGPFGPYTAWRVDGLVLLEGDLFDLPPDVHADAIYDRAATIALPQPMRDRYAARLAQVVGPGAPMLLTTLAYPQHERNGPPFSVPQAEVERLYADAFDVSPRQTTDDEPLRTAWGLSSLTESVYTLRRR